MKRFAALAIATLILSVGGCSHEVIGTRSAKLPTLFLQLKAKPAELYTSQTSLGRTVYFTMNVTDTADKDFTGVATIASVIHVTVRSGDKVIWEGPELAMREEKPARVKAKHTSDYLAVWHIDNVDDLPPGNLVVEAVYTPTGDVRTLMLPVGDEMPQPKK